MYEDEALQNAKNGVNSIYRVGKELYNFLKKANDNVINTAQTAGTAVSTQTAQGFTFTGKPTDFIFFEENKSMSKSVLDSINDPKIKNAVLDNLIKAEKEGLISVDLENGRIGLTEKGAAHLKNPEFIKQAYTDQSHALQNPFLVEQSFGVELNGTDRDLNFFNHSNELDLKSIAKNPDTKTAEKIFENFAKLEKKGMVSVTPNNMLKITKSGEQLLSSSAFKLANGKLAEKAIAAVPVAGTITAITKKILTVVQQISNSRSQSKGQVL